MSELANNKIDLYLLLDLYLFNANLCESISSACVT